MLKKYSKLFVLLLAIFDAFIIGLSFLLAYYLRFHSNIFEIPNIHPFNFYFEFFILVIPLWIILLTSFELYKPRRTSSIFVDAKPIFWANTLGILILCSISFFYRAHSYSRLTFVLFGGVNFILLLSSHCFIRGFLKSLRKKGFNKRRILIVGAGELGLRVAKTFQNHASYGYKVIGFLDDDHSNGMYEEYGFEILGRISSLRNCLKARDIDKVVITLPIKAYEKIYHIVAICEYEGIETDIVPDLFQVVQPVTKVINLDGLPIVSVRRTPVDSWQYKFLKRIFDIAFALLVLVITLPLTLLIAIAIKLSTPGPIFFKQERIGKNRRPFMMYKFRTMQPSSNKENDTTWTKISDKRRTKLGNYLRKTSLDELPQFLNVLKGEMSVVGPRPERPYFAKRFKGRIPKYMVRHQVWTGITGLAQVNGWRGDTSIRKRLEYDLFYLENWSLWLDFKIILKTLAKGFINKNAY